MCVAKQILKQDSKNFNKGTQEGDRLLEKSIKKFGFREAATLDKFGVLIGGNKRTAKAQKLGINDVQIIKADKNKIYALQYDDIDLGTPEGRELALALNQTAKENICIDVELVEAELTDVVCEEWSIGTGGEPNSKNSEDFFIPDTIYNSNNIYDIPTLKLEKQATDIHLPLKPYGAEKRTNGGVGTYHFYVDDYRFESIWKLADLNGAYGVHVTSNGKSDGVYLDRKSFKTYDQVRKAKLAAYKSKFSNRTNKPTQHTVVHELAHALWTNHHTGDKQKKAAIEIGVLYRTFKRRNPKSWGSYSKTNINEFFAEGITKGLLGKPDSYTKALIKISKKYGL